MSNLLDEARTRNTGEPMMLVIHGPTWTNRMPLDAHALTTVIPELTANGWTMEANARLGCIDMFSPVLLEDAA